MTGVRQIGELDVDRESIERVLSDSPQSLQTILDALMDALRQETSSLYKAVESEEEEELLAMLTGGLESECDAPFHRSVLLGTPDLPHAAHAELLHQPIRP